MTSRLHIQGDESVLLHITHSNITSFSADVSFSLQMTVEGVKEKLWKKCGTSVNSMCLELYDDTGAKISDLSDKMKPLGFYSPQDGFRLHVIDIDPSSVTSGGWLEDTSLVEKYTISEEAYDKLDGTFRKFKEKFAHQSPSAHESKMSDNYMEDLCANIKVGDRCQVELGEKRGVIKFVGRAETLGPSLWVGIQYDEPLGKHDGMGNDTLIPLLNKTLQMETVHVRGVEPLLGQIPPFAPQPMGVKGMRYFDCPPLHGAMVRPDKVKVGNYPERDPFEEEEI